MVKDKYFPDIWKDCEVRVAYTLSYNIPKFLKKRTALIRTYTTPLLWFRRKLEKVQQDMIKQPGNFINKTKRDIKKKVNGLEKEYPAFSEFHLAKPDRFVGDFCQKLGITKDVLIYFEKYVNTFVSNNGSLLDRYG